MKFLALLRVAWARLTTENKVVIDTESQQPISEETPIVAPAPPSDVNVK